MIWYTVRLLCVVVCNTFWYPFFIISKVELCYNFVSHLHSHLKISRWNVHDITKFMSYNNKHIWCGKMCREKNIIDTFNNFALSFNFIGWCSLLGQSTWMHNRKCSFKFNSHNVSNAHKSINHKIYSNRLLPTYAILIPWYNLFLLLLIRQYTRFFPFEINLLLLWFSTATKCTIYTSSCSQFDWIFRPFYTIYWVGWEIDVVHTSVDTFCSVTLFMFDICVAFGGKPSNFHDEMKIQCYPFHKKKTSFNKGNYIYFTGQNTHHSFRRSVDKCLFFLLDFLIFQMPSTVWPLDHFDAF